MGPLIGGLITTAISWRVAFVFQAAIIVIILVLARSITDPVRARRTYAGTRHRIVPLAEKQRRRSV
jgi:MFS family permease